jgi:hypothetical protein
MKISSILLSALAVNAMDFDQLRTDKDEKKRHPTNKLARLNKILNQYTVWAKGMQVDNINLEEKILVRLSIETINGLQV